MPNNNYKVGIEIETETNDSAKKIGGVKESVGELGGAFGEGLGDIDAFGVSLGDLINPTTLVAGGVAALGTALFETGQHAAELSQEVDTATASIQTKLGLTTDQAGQFRDTMREIYTDNFGSGFDDIAESLTAVETNLERVGGDQSQANIKAMTENAIAFGDAFHVDVGESASAAATLMQNFGLSSQQAFDFLTKGEQEGLDASGDFLDTIGEYSVQFGKAGTDAGQFFSILETGNQGGVLGTDKVADAVKEFSLRIVDNSTTTKTALSNIGIDYDKLKQGFQDGSITQVDAMQTVIDKINQIQDPVQKNVAGVALFGTQWEDLTGTVITQIDTQKTKLGELEGAAKSLQDQYDHTGTSGQSAMREWNNALVDVGDSLNGLKDIVMPGLTLILDTLVIPKVKEFADWLHQAQDIAKTVMDWFNNIGQYLPGGTPSAQGSSLPVATTSSLSLTPALATASAAGTQIYQQFYIERGDPTVVQNAASTGLAQAQRSRGE